MAYGFQTFNADGTIGLDATETALRFIGSSLIVPAFSGNISMPNFDSNRGSYSISAYYFKYNYINNTRVADTASMGGQYRAIVSMLGNEELPTRRNSFPILSWNNSTKLLTVTPNGGKSEFRIIFYHHK